MNDHQYDLMNIDYALFQLSEAINYLSDVTMTMNTGPFPANEVQRVGAEAARLLNIVANIPVRIAEQT